MLVILFVMWCEFSIFSKMKGEAATKVNLILATIIFYSTGKYTLAVFYNRGNLCYNDREQQ